MSGQMRFDAEETESFTHTIPAGRPSDHIEEEGSVPEMPPKGSRPGSPEYQTWLTARVAQQAAAAGMSFSDEETSTEDESDEGDEQDDQGEEQQAAATAPTDLEVPEAPAPTAEGKPGKVDTAKYTQELLTGGALSDESYAELEAAGYDRAMVDGYVAGQKALKAQNDAKVAETLQSFGGADEFKAMSSWAATKMPKAEVAELNKLLGKTETLAMGLRLLSSAYKEANGAPPRKTIHGGKADAGGAGYGSMDEAAAAAQDPRYKNDARYRAEHRRKLEAMLG